MSARLSSGFSLAHLSPSIDGAMAVDQLLDASAFPRDSRRDLVRGVLRSSTSRCIDDHAASLQALLADLATRPLDDGWPLDFFDALPRRCRTSRGRIHHPDKPVSRRSDHAPVDLLLATRDTCYREDPVGFMLMLGDSRCPAAMLWPTTIERSLSVRPVITSWLYPPDSFRSYRTLERLLPWIKSGFSSAHYRLETLEDELLIHALTYALVDEPESRYCPFLSMIESVLRQLVYDDHELLGMCIRHWNDFFTCSSQVAQEHCPVLHTVEPQLQFFGKAERHDIVAPRTFDQARANLATEWMAIQSRIDVLVEEFAVSGGLES